MAEAKSTPNYSVGDIVGTLELLSLGDGRRKHWQCRCITCGHERQIRSDHIKRFIGADCRCGVPAFVKTHGLSKKREFRIWLKMIDRCHCERRDNYAFYGAIGRYVCPRWRESFDAFHADMGDAPSADHSIDRIDTAGSYTCGKCDDCKAKQAPPNCRWATSEVQHRNASNNRYYTHDGKTLILKDWARLVGIGYLTLFARLERGWSFERAVSTPPRKLTRGNR